MDTRIKDKFQTPKYIRIFIDTLFKKFQILLADGVTTPQSIINYTNSYFESETIRGFIHRNFQVSTPDKRLPFNRIQEAYEDEFHKRIGLIALSKELRSNNFVVTKISNFYYLSGYKKSNISNPSEIQNNLIIQGDNDANDDDDYEDVLVET